MNLAQKAEKYIDWPSSSQEPEHIQFIKKMRDVLVVVMATSGSLRSQVVGGAWW